ncbi:polyhydroxyalkanoate synthesis protein PhaF [Angustibacter luteus]|uniref:Polyhydroxyalkanoate synthesis protein PhaF n=1 Tax=Angustibacter luteus TaxID=658456 RepID=A0ABW1J8U3_9ACTN
MFDAVRGYLQLVSGLSQVSRQRAVEVAKQLLATTPAAEMGGAASMGAQAVSGQVSALADELMATGRQNRQMLRTLVRAEVETVVARLGLAGNAELEAALAASRARVLELERELAVRDAEAVRRPSRTSAAEKSTAKKSTAKKSTAKRSTAKKAAAMQPSVDVPAAATTPEPEVEATTPAGAP